MNWSMMPGPFQTGRPMGPMHLIPYVVQSGDSVFIIAQKFKTTSEAIIGANCLPDPNLINVGQILYIPCPMAAAPTAMRQPAAQPMSAPEQRRG